MSGERGGRSASPWAYSDLVPLLPLLAAAWEDGVLSPAEVRAMQARLAPSELLTAEARAELDRWTRPDDPPHPVEVATLRRWIRGVALPDAAGLPPSLADLGLALWDQALGSGTWSDEASRRALREAERDAGILGVEAVRSLLARTVHEPARDLGAVSSAPIDASWLSASLERDHHDVRQRVRELLPRPELTIAPGLPHAAYRARVLEVVRFLAHEGLGSLAYPENVGGQQDPGAAVAVFETLAFGDLSTLVKFGVQFGLFGGSIHQLGTERHHAAYLPAVGRLDLPGCFAMSETGHGSNVRDLETTATYDHERAELVVHSPHEAAGKDWIGNAALHGRLATVFARLIVEGDDHGVHAVLVPLRDENGAVLPGVRIEDRGLKFGLNGVDNGRIWFHQVRVPVGNLLDRFASIDGKGRYHSPIPGSGRRFFTMLGTLVAGRVSIASAAVSATKVGLVVALRHAAARHQFGPSGGTEIPILDYRLVQRDLMPALATTYALHFAVRDLQARFAESATGRAEDPELEVRAAGLKAYASDHCSDALRRCREACGGQGDLAENRFGALRADTDVFTTFEGANAVLYQLVAKGLLFRFRESMGDLDARSALRYLGERVEGLVARNPVATRRTEAAHLLDPAFQSAALQYREDRLLHSAALRIRARLREGTDSFQAVNEVQDHLVALARAHVERCTLHAFLEGVEALSIEAGRTQAATSTALRSLAGLYGLSRIEADRGWFLEAGYIEAGKSRAIREQVNALCRTIAADSVSLADAFAVPEALLPPLVRRR
jgi:acyl-CoA oxidase